MTTKRIVLVAGVSLALVMALGAGVLVGSLAGNSAFAQGPTGTTQGFGPGMMGRGLVNGQQYTGTMPYGGRGMMGGVAPSQSVTGTAPFAGGFGMMGGTRGLGYNEVMLPSLAKGLGLTVEQLQAELKAGKTVADLAKAKGIAVEKLAADMLAAHKEYLAGLVKDGKITQQAADWMIERMEQVENHPCLTGEWFLARARLDPGVHRRAWPRRHDGRPGHDGELGHQGTTN